MFALNVVVGLEVSKSLDLKAIDTLVDILKSERDLNMLADALGNGEFGVVADKLFGILYRYRSELGRQLWPVLKSSLSQHGLKQTVKIAKRVSVALTAADALNDGFPLFSGMFCSPPTKQLRICQQNGQLQSSCDSSCFNAPPRITSKPDYWRSHDLLLGEQWEYRLRAEDADGDPLTAIISNGPGSATISPAGAGSWIIRYIPTLAELEENSNRGSVLFVFAVADDQSGTDVQKSTLSFSKPTSLDNRAPYFTTVPVTNARVGELYLLPLMGSDPDGDDFRFRLDRAPNGMTLDSGSLRWRPNANQIGSHSVTVTIIETGLLPARSKMQFSIQVSPQSPTWYNNYDFASKGAVAYLPLDGNTNDVTGNENDGTNNGATIATGKFGDCYRFNGSNYIRYTEQYAGLTTITYAMWFNAESLYTYPEQQQHTGRMPFKRRGGYADHWVSFWTNRLGVTLYDINTGALVDSPVSTGVWHHLAFGSDGINVFAYLDGNKVFDTPGGGQIDWSKYIGTFIGHSYDSGSQSNWIGGVDELAVFNRRLTDSEFARLARDDNDNDIADFWDYQVVTIDIPGLAAGARQMKLVRIPAGTFQMGSPDTERGRSGDEGPVHTVTLTNDFYIGETEVTQAQWQAIMEYNPASDYGVGPDYPVYYVSWDDCQFFISALNAKGQGTFRLPSEAEWEYACRARTGTRFFFGDSLGCTDTCEDCDAGILSGNRSNFMWWCGNSGGLSHPVGVRSANDYGLYDMHGNVWEWCEDWYNTSYNGAPMDGNAWLVQDNSNPYRVLRGGDWYLIHGASRCRSAARNRFLPASRNLNYGFRLVRNP